MPTTNESDGRAPAFKKKSPEYPSVDLERAVALVRDVHKKIGSYPTTPQHAAEIWGYSPKSSGGIRAVAALGHYGLMAGEGKSGARKVALTERGVLIAKTDSIPDDPDRREALRAAAREPRAHQRVLEKFPAGLPSDELLKQYLLKELDFNETAVGPLIEQLRATLAYADGVSSSARPFAAGPLEPPAPQETPEPKKQEPMRQKTPPLPEREERDRDDDGSTRVVGVCEETGVRIEIVLPRDGGMKALRRATEIGETVNKVLGIQFPD